MNLNLDSPFFHSRILTWEEQDHGLIEKEREKRELKKKNELKRNTR